MSGSPAPNEPATVKSVEDVRDRGRTWLKIALIILVAVLAMGTCAVVLLRGQNTDASDRITYVVRYLNNEVPTPAKPGTDGVRGATGAQGLRGPQGFAGPNGLRGPRGFRGFQGAPASREDIAENVALFCADGRCRGAQGPRGPAGAQGGSGSQGDTGRSGTDGRDGTNGKDGTAGRDGERGPGPTDAEIDASVARYCDARGTCGVGAVGPQGPSGPTPTEDEIAEAVALYCSTRLCGLAPSIPTEETP